jgi:hypothetical protein
VKQVARIGRTIGRETAKKYGAAYTSIVVGVILILIGLGFGVNLLLLIRSGKAAFAEDRQLWKRDAIARVVEMGDGYSIVEYKYNGETGTAKLLGTPGAREAVGSRVAVWYEIKNPSNIAREVWTISSDVMSIVFPTLFGIGMLALGLYVKKAGSRKPYVPEEVKQNTEAVARRELTSGENLLSYCTVVNKSGWYIFFLMLSFLPIVFAIGMFSAAVGDDFVPFTILAALLAIAGVVCVRYAWITFRKSSYEYCFVTDKRLCLRGKANVMLDIDVKDIQAVEFRPQNTLSVHDFIVFRALKENGSGSKNYNLAAKFNAEEMAKALQSINGHRA